jgi:drug/metabolite transporter (DMT)-like permease
VITRTTGAREQLGSTSLVGLLLGLVGVGALVGLDLAGASALPLVEIAVVAVCYAVGPIVLARFLGGLSSLGVIAVSLGVCALVYAPVAAFELPSQVPSWKATASVLVLAVICSALAFVLFFALIAEIGPVRATVITYVNPAVAAVLGVTVLSETFTIGMGVGFALILLGSVLATRAKRAAGGFEAEPLAATAER